MRRRQRLDGVNRIATEERNSIPLSENSKIVIIGDHHRGKNTWGDDFADNANLLLHALQYYYHAGFTYIELGDGEELWENRKFEDIRQTYAEIYWWLHEFNEKGRLYLIWGNHNRVWRNANKVSKKLSEYVKAATQESQDLFKNARVYEGLKLEKDNHRSILLTHGHQGDLPNDQLWWIGKAFVRYIWRVPQFFGIRDPFSASQSNRKQTKLEEEIKEWTELPGRCPIIVGHTHRSWFPLEGAAYFNTGSCVGPRCITGIEIDKGQVSLVKWSLTPQYSADPDPGGKQAVAESVPLMISKKIVQVGKDQNECTAPLSKFVGD